MSSSGVGYIEIRVTGKKGNNPITPDSIDISEIRAMLEQAEHLLFPNEKTNRPPITYAMEEGSVKHIFKTALHAIIGFNAILNHINENNTIDFLSLNASKAIESFQNLAVKRDYAIQIKTSVQNSPVLTIDKTTHFYRNTSLWVDAELYFYGKIIDAGGKDKANIHIVTDDLGRIKVETPIEFLEKQEQNILYKEYGVRALGKQNAETGEIDTNSLKIVELISYSRDYDEEYLNGLRQKAKWLKSINPDQWLNEIRGYDA